jgi:hypothetical protein
VKLLKVTAVRVLGAMKTETEGDHEAVPAEFQLIAFCVPATAPFVVRSWAETAVNCRGTWEVVNVTLTSR